MAFRPRPIRTARGFLLRLRFAVVLRRSHLHYCRVADLTPKTRSILGLSNSGRCGRENHCEEFALQRLALCDERLTGPGFLTAILCREDSKRKWPATWRGVRAKVA